ncbi:putative neutral sphingomyelinase [Penaeus indicus]|uniref:putative neutral sphingomyelinase n=1 Tax=Penaeus indicus TaxID=29960 RepID=UPI00300C4D41
MAGEREQGGAGASAEATRQEVSTEAVVEVWEQMTVPEHVPKDTNMAVDVKVLTLNIWGIPLLAKDKNARVDAIANQLLTGPDEFDFVFLQEVWSKEDYHKIATKILAVCRTTRHGIPITLINMHLHALYDHKNDTYVHHRAVQAYEAAQLLRLGRTNEDVVIFSGDMNCTQTDFAYRLVKHNGALIDTYIDSPVKTPGSNGETNETPANSYTSVKTLMENPCGHRIDYIFYQSSQAYKVKTKVCDLPFPQRVPQQEFSFSDHEAVRTVLTITPMKGTEIMEEIPSVQAKTDALLECSAVCEQGLKSVGSQQKLYIALSVLCAIVLLVCHIVICTESSSGVTRGFLGLLLILFTFCLSYLLFMATIFYRFESNKIKETKLGIEHQLDELREKNAQIFEEERKRSQSFIK